jgi:hypothetical protein
MRIRASLLGFTQRIQIGVDTKINRMIEGDARKMPIATTHIEHRLRKVYALVVGSFNRPEEGSEIRQFAQVCPQEIRIGHTISPLFFIKD